MSSERRDKKWEATITNKDKNERAKDLYEFLWKKGELPRKSRYQMVKYLISEIGVPILYNEQFSTISNILYDEKLIHSKKLKDVVKYLIFVGMHSVKEEYERKYPDAFA